MYPLEFREFAKAVGVSEEVIRTINECFIKRIPVDSFIHSKMMDVFADCRPKRTFVPYSADT